MGTSINWADYGALGVVVAALLGGLGWLVRYLCLKLLSDGKADGSGKGLLVRWMDNHERFVASIDSRTQQIEERLGGLHADAMRKFDDLLSAIGKGK